MTKFQIFRRELIGAVFAAFVLSFLKAESSLAQGSPSCTNVQPVILAPSDGTTLDIAGSAVSAFADRVLLGAPNAWRDSLTSPNARGVAYVFRRSGTNWIEEQKLVASDAALSDRFGSTAVLGQDMLLVGAPKKSNFAGAVYGFRFNGTNWVQSQKLLPSDTATNFGFSLAMDGAQAFIGASGAIYVFRYDGQNWTQTQKISLSGAAMHMSGNFAIIGASDHTLGSSAGAAYVFRWNGSSWVQQAKLLAADGRAYQSFGSSVSISADGLAVVGAKDDNDLLNSTYYPTTTGAAYVFRLNPNSQLWQQEAKLYDTWSNAVTFGTPGDFFGTAATIWEDTILVGATYWEDRTLQFPPRDVGAVHAYRYDAAHGNWMLQARIAGPLYPGSLFGGNLANSQSALVTGAPYGDFQGQDSGGAYVYDCVPAISLPQDTVPPTVSISGVTNGQNIVANTTVTKAITATVTDNLTVSRVEFYLNGALVVSDNTSPFSFTWVASREFDGAHTIVAKAYDQANNSASSAVTVNISKTPTLSLLSPQNGATLSGIVTLQASIDSQVRYYIDGYIRNYAFSAPATFAWDTRFVSDGPHTIRITQCGNTQSQCPISPPVTVYVDNGVAEAPIISASIPLNGYIDALEDRDASSGALLGTKDLSITFSSPVANAGGGALTLANFERKYFRGGVEVSAAMADLANSGVAPSVTLVSGTGAGPYLLRFTPRIPLGAWSQIKAINVVEAASGTPISATENRVVFGNLPMDITQDGKVFGDDISRWLAINGNSFDPAPLTKVQLLDQKRNGTVAGEDITRGIQLINGVGTFRAWSGFDMGVRP